MSFFKFWWTKNTNFKASPSEINLLYLCFCNMFGLSLVFFFNTSLYIYIYIYLIYFKENIILKTENKGGLPLCFVFFIKIPFLLMYWNQGCFEVCFTPLLLHRAVLGCGGATAASCSSSWLGWRMFVFGSCWLPPCGRCPTLGRFPLLLCWRAPQSFSTWPGLEHRWTSGLWLELSVRLAAGRSERFQTGTSTPC